MIHKFIQRKGQGKDTLCERYNSLETRIHESDTVACDHYMATKGNKSIQISSIVCNQVDDYIRQNMVTKVEEHE